MNSALPLILFLDNAVDVPSLECHERLSRHVESNWGHRLQYHHIPSDGTETLKNLQPAAIISLGSASNVGDGSSWHRPLAEYLQHQLQKNIGVLGICFTHQLMADYWGAKVVAVREDLQPLEGARAVPWPSTTRPSTWIVSHSYHVINPPAQLQTLASTSMVPHEVLRHRQLPYLSIQAHPEASMAFVQLLDQRPSIQETHQSMNDGLRFIDLFLREVARLPERA